MTHSTLLDPHPDFEFVNAAPLRTPEGFRAWRHSHKLLQAELGELLDVSNVTISRWERGTAPIPRMAELALAGLDSIQDLPAPAPEDNAPPLSPADELLAELLAERGDDADGPAFRANHADDLEAATAGDKRAMIRLRKACGLPAFKPHEGHE